MRGGGLMRQRQEHLCTFKPSTAYVQQVASQAPGHQGFKVEAHPKEKAHHTLSLIGSNFARQ